VIQDIFNLQNPWRRNSKYSFSLKERFIFNSIINNLKNNLIIGLVGSRQVGKSSILYLVIEHLIKSGTRLENIFYFNLDDFKLHELFESITSFIEFTGNNHETKFIFIDEIQRLSAPGLFLKEIFDLKKDVKIFFSGSSQLEVRAKTKEHLVGRARIFNVQRLNLKEYIDFSAPITKKEALQQMLIYGSYPAVAKENSILEKKLRIRDIYQSYIQKDLVDFLKIDKTDAYNKFLKKIAYQSGDLLNINALSNTLKIPRHEIEKYVEILEHTFICKRIYPFHKNYGKEITKTPKIYFLDLGLRNYLLNNFNKDLSLREDIGKLFENFVFNEMLTEDIYSFKQINFWRTTNQTEIDFIVQGEDLFKAIEVKWNSMKEPKSFSTIKERYPGIETKVVSRNDFL
jgi:uncharacterized protein